MTLQKLNILLLLLWTITGSLTQLVTSPLWSIIFTILTFIIVFIMSGVSLYYSLFYRHQFIINDAVLLTSVGLIFSIFFIPLVLFLTDLVLPINHPLILSFIYIAFLLLPLLRAPLPFLALPPLRHSYILKIIRHPVFLSFALILTTHLVCLNQYSFLPGLDAYTWLLKYEVSLSSQIYDLSAGPNRILFSTLVAVFHQLSHAPFFSIFKYWFPLLSLLPLFPLWLIARTFKSPLHQLLLLLSPLASPALILDWETTRHHVVLLLFLYLSLGLLFTAHRYQQPILFHLTFLASFIGLLYHPLFLILIIFWLFSALMIHRPFINQHPLITISAAFLFFIVAHFLNITSLFTNIFIRLSAATSNFINFRWNLRYPAAFIGEGMSMGWPGLTGVLKYYGYYAGPLTLAILLTTFLFIYFFPAFRRRIFQVLCTPFLVPISSFLLILLFLAEILPRFAGIAYLPDRAWLLIGIPTIIFIPFLFNFTSSQRLQVLLLSLYSVALLISVTGTIYINHALAFSIPDYELTAAAWMKDNLPSNAHVFTSSSKNILRYYARVKLLWMDPRVITSDNSEAILSRVGEYHDIIDPTKTYIYYAVTDPRNPFVERQYVSSFTQARPPSLFPALTSHPDKFELVYSKLNLVYLWRIK
ncbi:MAG: hypothetical protein A3E37_04990 [Candidatus Andersenbacteria bacterium RIFCSPHIGHO2_12_FULL_46_9]|nr:MAG: hypothetical protein A3B76_02805 [Candidatus Andersenbacteria bacterium RIFCSPHIGHO2_02_FULL_46_16]OGY36201.1 MAG: hypothetical protein A3I08_05125 [Candidatus Andersenbacteria bacterium RIFCSPLOWO2_02_FULL_46_11]OGY36964.1 MAG: hypothetical protein A3E37_04990 [Candidatus Andersenbacteria bacterium RIFCSPHIGHO2_12_FULL_46_9]OGY40786.1 MAG: hypothetical protein A3G57_02795 [Candidatus Andersenbacteria bacterium RIFCSPLOWO2_12_FULL_45_8]HBE89854.1 hypothetical protein [Candidatus Anderse